MSDSLTEGYKDSSKYRESERQFHRMLARRNELQEIVREKYPEVMELLETYYHERDWHR